MGCDVVAKSHSKQSERHENGRRKSCPPKRGGRSSADNVTKWSYYHDGDVEIPEICVYSIDSRCSFEDQGCLRLHAKCTSQWQLLHRSVWCNFRNFHSIEIEEAYEDPSSEGVQLSPVDPTKLGKTGQDMFKILGTGVWIVDFKDMMLKEKGSSNVCFNIRRLSTQSSAESKSAKATTYAWYFMDINNKWIKYGQSDSSQSNDYVSSITSEEVEKHYSTSKSELLSFSTSKFKYELDLMSMEQTNLETKMVRSVRRRPIKKTSTKLDAIASNRNIIRKQDSATEDLPPFWSAMKGTDEYMLVVLDAASDEYKDIAGSLLLTLPSKRAQVIKRVQNPFLWRAFKNMQKKLSLKYGSEKRLNIQRLFHGTKEEHVLKICAENFDWRLYGSNVGHAYGMGSYFSNSAAVAMKYCTPDAHGRCFMLVAMAIVGEIVRGSSNMTRPPLNPSNQKLYDTTVDNVSTPKIFVKFDNQEYCPMYVVEFV